MSNFLTIVLLIVFITSCNQRILTGYYSSNNAELGFFVTRLQLNPDSTFKYDSFYNISKTGGDNNNKVEENKVEQSQKQQQNEKIEWMD